MLNNSIGIIRNTYLNFIKNYKQVFLFEIIYKLMISIIIIPINQIIINRFITNTGLINITNTELIRFALSIRGIITIVLILVVYFIAIFLEVSVLTYIATNSHKGREVSLIEAIKNSFNLLPKTFNIYIIPMILVTGIIGPLTDAGIYTSILKNLSIPSFITIELDKTIYGKILITVFTFIIVIGFFRWILSIPSIFIEDLSLKDSFKNSLKIYKKNTKEIIYYLILWGIINFLIRRIAVTVYFLIGSLIILILGRDSFLSLGFINIYLPIFIFIYTIISVITVPLFISFLVELYYKYRNYEVLERSFLEVSTNNWLYKFSKKYKQKISIFICIVFFMSVLMSSERLRSNHIEQRRIDITAHRGSSRAPENSMSSIQLAFEEGADYCEIDVMTSKDDNVVLFHDSTLKRIDSTNRKIKNMTLDEIKRVDNGSYFHKSYSDEKIPTLEEVLVSFKGKMKFNIELKPVGKSDTLPYEVSKLIKKYNMEEEVVVSSLDYESIQKFKSYMPSVNIGYILTLGVGDFTQLDVDFISVEYEMLSKELTHRMSLLGKSVHVWTLNDEKRIINSAKLGANNIITDNVDIVRESLWNQGYVFGSYTIDLETGEREEFTAENDELDYIDWFRDCLKYIVGNMKI